MRCAVRWSAYEPGSDGGVVGGMLLLIANVFLVPCRFQSACR